MLIGEYKHNLDAKKRLAVPSKFRKELGEGAVLTRGLDNCLFVFPMKHWNQLVEKIAGLPISHHDGRSFSRLMLSGASVVAGVYSRLEIWDENKWESYKADLEKNSDAIAEKLGEMGAI